MTVEERERRWAETMRAERRGEALAYGRMLKQVATPLRRALAPHLVRVGLGAQDYRQTAGYQGFGDWIEALPAALQKKAAQNMYAGFESVPNRKNVWQRTQTIDDSELVVIAIQTGS